MRARRKALRISAVAAAEAAGISRVTLHRIEKGEPSVTAGAYIAALAALALEVRFRHGEYRESVDIDFLVSAVEHYRALRTALTGPAGLAAIA